MIFIVPHHIFQEGLSQRNSDECGRNNKKKIKTQFCFYNHIKNVWEIEPHLIEIICDVGHSGVQHCGFYGDGEPFGSVATEVSCELCHV
jgi:hypothetical protein